MQTRRRWRVKAGYNNNTACVVSLSIVHIRIFCCIVIFQNMGLQPLNLQPEVSVLGAFAKLRKATINFIMFVCTSVRQSVRMEQVCSQWADFHEISYLSSVQNLQRKIKSHKYWTRITGIVHIDQQTFTIKSRSILLRMKNVQTL